MDLKEVKNTNAYRDKRVTRTRRVTADNPQGDAFYVRKSRARAGNAPPTHRTAYGLLQRPKCGISYVTSIFAPTGENLGFNNV